MNLGTAPGKYDPASEAQARATLEREDARNMKLGGVFERIILKSPDGTKWAITVDDSGTIASAAL